MFNKGLKKKIVELEKQVRQATGKLVDYDRCRTENVKLKDINKELCSKVNDLQGKVRTQTEADLFFEYHKAADELKSGKVKEDIQTRMSYIEQLHNLRTSQAQSMQNVYSYGSLGGLLPALTGRGI